MNHQQNFTKKQILELARETEVGPDDMIPRMESSEFAGASSFRFETEASFLINMESIFCFSIHDICFQLHLFSLIRISLKMPC